MHASWLVTYMYSQTTTSSNIQQQLTILYVIYTEPRIYTKLLKVKQLNLLHSPVPSINHHQHSTLIQHSHQPALASQRQTVDTVTTVIKYDRLDTPSLYKDLFIHPFKHNTSRLLHQRLILCFLKRI